MLKPDVTPCKVHLFSDIELEEVKRRLLKGKCSCFLDFKSGLDMQWIVKKLLTTETVIWTIRFSLIGEHYLNVPL